MPEFLKLFFRNVRLDQINSSSLAVIGVIILLGFFDMDVTDEKKLFVLLSNFSLPQKDVEKLIGRDEDLQEVERKLNANGFLNVFGEKGVGKTSLVLSLLDRIWANYDYLLWIDASSVEALHLSLSRLSGLAAASKDGSQRSTLPEALEMSRQWIIEYIKEGNGKLLIIFDGLKDGSRLAAIPNFPPKLSDEASSSLNVLVTSKHRVDDLEHFKKFEFHYLNKLRDEIVMRSLLDIRTDYHDEQSVSEELFPNEQLTYKYQDASNRSEEAEAATWIAKKVDSSLLFVTVVKSFLKKEETVALAEYQEELENELAGSQISPKEGILAVFERFLPAIKDVINFLAFCDSSSVPTELFQYLHFKETLDSQSPKKRREQLSNCPSKAVSYFLAIDRLSDYRLVKLEREKLIVMHQEIAKTAYQRLRSKEKKEHVAILCNVLLITFIKHNNWGMISSLYPHALRCLDHMEKLKLFDADLLLECGRMKSLLGDSRAAKELLEKCLNDSRASVYHKAMAHLHLTTVERRLSKLNVALERIDAAKSIWDSWKDPSKLCGFEKNKTIEAEAEVLLDAGEFTLAQTQLDKIGNPHDLYDDDNVSRSSLFANKARAHLGLGNYKESSEFYSRAIKYIPQRDYRHSMFQAYECIASALCCAKEEDEPATYEVFSKEVDRCEDISKSMTHSHRYYAWVCRSVARLRHRQVKLLEKLNQGDDVESDIRSALKKAFQMVRVCIECHLAIFSGKHQKVAKACDLVGDLCCLWYETIGPRKKVLKCAMKHFQCARDIFKAHSTEDKENRLSAIKTRLESVEEKLTTNADRESNMSQCVEDEEDFQEEGIFDVLHNLGIKIAELK